MSCHFTTTTCSDYPNVFELYISVHLTFEKNVHFPYIVVIPLERTGIHFGYTGIKNTWTLELVLLEMMELLQSSL